MEGGAHTPFSLMLLFLRFYKYFFDGRLR